MNTTLTIGQTVKVKFGRGAIEQGTVTKVAPAGASVQHYLTGKFEWMNDAGFKRVAKLEDVTEHSIRAPAHNAYIAEWETEEQ